MRVKSYNRGDGTRVKEHNRAGRGRSKDLEFEISDGDTRIGVYKSAHEASAIAVAASISRGGSPITIDVITWTRRAAIAYAGDYGAEVYDMDPDASVHDRIVVRAESKGRIA